VALPGSLFMTRMTDDCVTPEKLINALNRLETSRYYLRRYVSGASLDTVLLGTVKRSFVSETVSKTEHPVPF